MSFFEELKRRKVFRVAATYAVVAWILMQIGEVTFPALNIPEWVMSTLVVILLAVFPIVVIFAWVFDKTPQGFIKTDSPQTEGINSMNVKMDDRPFYFQKKNIILALGVIVGILIGTYSGDSFKSSVDKKSIAVLPFDNYSTAKEDEYFSDGMTEVIIANLAKVKDLKVISRTSVMEYKNTTKKLRDIAQELGVAHILEGSIQRSNGRVRVVGQLIDANTDEHIWAETYDRDESDLFELQSSVAIEIAKAMKSELTIEEKTRINEVLTNSTPAYEYYLKGNMYDNAGHVEFNMLAAIKEYERSVALDSSFAEAHARLGKMHAHLRWYGVDLSEKRMIIAKKHIDKAMSLKPNNSVVRTARGVYFYHGYRDYGKAMADFQYARDLEPGNAMFNLYVGTIYRRLGDYVKAQESMAKAFDLDPRSLLILQNLQGTIIFLRDYDSANQLGNLNLKNQRIVYWNAFSHYYSTGDLDKAFILISDNEFAKKNQWGQLDLALKSRKFDKANKIIKTIDQNVYSNEVNFFPKDYYMGIINEGLGEKEKAKDFFRKSVDFLNNHVYENPLDSRAFAALGLTYARLGLKNKAIDSINIVEKLLPISKDALFGTMHAKNIGNTYAIISDKEKSLEMLEYLSSLSAGYHYGELLNDPDFDSIRNEQRFQNILKKLEPKS